MSNVWAKLSTLFFKVLKGLANGNISNSVEKNNQSYMKLVYLESALAMKLLDVI